MRFLVYLILLFLFLTILFFTKPDYIAFKKYSCPKNITIRHISSDYSFDNICENIQKSLDSINVNEDIKVFILPKFFYKLFLFGYSNDCYLNVVYPSIYLNQDFSYDIFKNTELLERLYSLKLLLKTPLLSYLSIPSWKIKGYVHYIINEVDKFHLSDICYEDKKNNFGYVEFENKIVVKYLIEIKHYNEKNLFEDNLYYQAYLDEAKRYYCK
ncbi:MAG: hypothetical protein N2Z20_05865 [Elusimicrobiales bacterium]|nr:hypothetical protein [Elusimicrobiales bacterium]